MAELGKTDSHIFGNFNSCDKPCLAAKLNTIDWVVHSHSLTVAISFYHMMSLLFGG